MGVVIGDGDEGMTVQYNGDTVYISGAVVGGISVGPDGITISEPSRSTVNRRGQTFTGIDVGKIVDAAQAAAAAGRTAGEAGRAAGRAARQAARQIEDMFDGNSSMQAGRNINVFHNDGVVNIGSGGINVTNCWVNNRYVDNETFRSNDRLDD